MNKADDHILKMLNLPTDPHEREDALLCEIIVLRHRLEAMQRDNSLLREKADLLQAKLMASPPTDVELPMCVRCLSRPQLPNSKGGYCSRSCSMLDMNERKRAFNPKEQDMKLTVCAVMAAMILMAGSAMAAKLQWEPNTEADWAGNNIYRAVGSCANPANFVKINAAVLPKSTVPVYTDNPAQDGDYCWVVTATDTGGLESLFSNKVGLTVNVNPPVAPQRLTVTP